MYNNITPEWIETLKENEIFVFGCRNSGRHFDGASAFALKHFGAIMGQREGRQGQSYAIPTIGGAIGLKEIRRSVNTFTQYAADHSELHFLVTPVGCGGGCCNYREIAPMFRKASKLPNVSLPQEFWDELDKGRLAEIEMKLKAHWVSWLVKVQGVLGRLRFLRIKMMSPRALYKELTYRDRECDLTSLSEQMEWGRLFDEGIAGSWKARYLINHVTKCAYMVLDNKSKVCGVRKGDINWESIAGLPKEVLQRVKRRKSVYSFEIYEYHDGVAKVVWQISPDGSYYYLDKYNGGKTTDEKDIRLCGVIDSEYRFVEKWRLMK